VRIFRKSFSKEIENAKISKSESGFWDSNEKGGFGYFDILESLLDQGGRPSHRQHRLLSSDTDKRSEIPGSTLPHGRSWDR
jgi:hypothetical protein